MQSVTLRALAAAVLALLAVTSMANAQQEGVYTIPHYKFETGQEMDNVKIGYVTYGKLNADKSNAVVLVPGTSSGRHWADEYVGPGKMYDTDKYFFIGVDQVASKSGKIIGGTCALIPRGRVIFQNPRGVRRRA
jgi:homoserine O-acetyltransferase/O-succinyltransferase